MQVNAETLSRRIKSLQARGNAEYALPLTLNEEYQLEAYKMLLAYLQASPTRPSTPLYTPLDNPGTCRHLEVRWSGLSKYCCVCGKELYNYD